MGFNTPRHHKLFWGSSYDRGLQYLLFMWSDIKKAFPDAELHICYGWDLFLKAHSNNPERMEWKRNMDILMEQEGIYHHGRVGKEELKKIRQECGIWAYSTDFTEINCITALECQKDGCVPVVMNFKDEINGEKVYTALEETIGAGIKVEGDIRTEEGRKAFLEALLGLMKDKKRWEILSQKGRKFAKKFYWEKIAEKWDLVFKEERKNPFVSVYTPTIREGWWNIMADNLARQTYKNFEWIIVDDYKEDRSEIAQKYAKKYNLEIRYFRGKKALGLSNRKCALVQANNLAWREAKGELFVDLQDFVLMPENGLEKLVSLYLHNPDCLIAPVDIYYFVKEPDKRNKEDWWNGETDIFLKQSWRNPRVKFLGIRETDNPFDFELNYGAIPIKILNELNGWWEFMDDGLGYDNTEIAFRALEAGYRILVDDTNIAKCINLWPEIKGTEQNVLGRERMLNPPRYWWLVEMVKKGKLHLRRDKKLDEKISLPFEVPKKIKDENCPLWIERNAEKIIKKWEGVI